MALHIVVSVGLLGLSTAMLVLATAAAATTEHETALAAYRSMAILTRGPVPVIAVSALASGIVLSLGTAWGLFRHYWIVTKLALTVAAILCGMLVIGPGVQRAVSLTSGASLAASPNLGGTPLLLVGVAAANVVMLGAATVISVYKPGGQIRRRRTSRQGAPRFATSPRTIA